ncbi:hypothetical protein EDD86DRAFT_248526 [Gorgonomyces haynaldii]|nr:hypothetical protein EDD86DRAFT_248526 [Gorgonomyces haynaldii]
MGGPGRYLLDILSRSNKIRQTWRIHNCGQPGSNSKDWIPKSVYFERLPQAEFAIVIVGSNDYLSLAAQDTLDYVHMICQELEKRGTTVILCPVSHKTIIGGPQMHELNYEYRGDFLYNGDYFSARGYKKLASDLADLLENRMVKMEFNSLKNLLFKK